MRSAQRRAELAADARSVRLTQRPRSGWSLLPLYIASAVLTLGEGAVAVLVPPYLDQRGLGAGVIGAVFAVYGVASLLARMPAATWYRAQRATVLVAGGCLLMAASFVLLPFTASALGVSVLIGLDGVGFAIATTAAMAALMDRRHPDADAGSIMGWYTGSLGLGYAAAGFVAGTVAESTSVTTAILVLAAVPAVAALLLAFALRVAPVAAPTAPPAPADPAVRRWSALRTAPPAVWLAFLVCLHVSMVHGVLSAFFPLYGLGVGLSIGQIGSLLGVHGIAAAGIRFLSGPLFRVLPYRRALPSMVLLNSAAVAAMGMSSAYGVFAVGWGAVGLSRGILRVASGALVMDEAGASDAQRGAASGIYLSGLDVGKIAGPALGGVIAEALGLRSVFLIVGVVFAAVYFAFVRRLRVPTASRRG